MISINSFLKQATIYSVSNIVNKAITIFLLPLYTHFLSPTEYGMFDFILLTINLINLTIALEIHQAIARFYAEWQMHKRKIYLSTALFFTLFVYSSFSLFVFLFKDTISELILGDRLHSRIIVYSIGMMWSSGIYYFAQSQLRWQMKSQQFAFSTFIFTITTFLSSLFFVRVQNFGLIGVINGITVGNTFGLITAILYSRNSYGLLFGWRKLLSMLKFSSPLVISSVSIFLLMYIDRIMIKNFLSFKDLGLFGIAYKFSSILSFLSLGVNNAILPLIYNNHKEINASLQISKILNLYIFFSFLIMSFISLFSKELILIFTTNQYLEATLIIPLLILITIISSISNFIPGLFIAKKTKLIAFINSMVAIFSLVANYFLIPKIGLLGSCYANIFAFTIGLTINYFVGQKYYPIYMDFVKIFKILFFSFLLIGLSMFGEGYYFFSNLLFKLTLIIFYLVICFIEFYSKVIVINKLETTFKYIFRK